MYFNRRNTAQKNWRMIKKGKHFLFGCSLVLAIGGTFVASSVKADTVEPRSESSTTNEEEKPTSKDESSTYVAPAVTVASTTATETDTAPATDEKPKEESETTVEKAKESDAIQAPSLTMVANSSALTEEEKANVVEAIKVANPTATDVQVQADGSAVVTFADGSTANLSAIQTVKVVAQAETSATQPKSRSRRAAVAEEKAEKAVETTQNSKEEPVVATEKAKEADGVQLPSLTVVADSSALTEEEKANIVEAVKGVNTTATDVQVQADGSVVVTFADGSTANLSATQTVKVVAQTETSATQPKSRSRRAAGQERSMEGRDIKYVWQNRQATLNGGDPTQRAKIEYRQLDDYEVVNGKTVPTDPSGQGRPVLEWTVTFNEAQYDKPGGYWYFTIPKNVSDPYNVVTVYDGVDYLDRYGWKDANKESNAGQAGKEGVQYIDDGNRLEMRVKNTTGARDYNKVDGLSGVMGDSKKVYVLQTSIYSGVRKFTVRYRTVVEDPSQTISYLAGVQSTGNLPRFNWNAISGKYDKELVSQVATPNVTPNLTETSVNVPVQTVASTSSTLSGTGTPGATIKLYIDGQEQNIGNVTVDSSGNWTTGELPTALNNNQGDGTTIKPRQTVQVSQTVNGTESSRRTVPVSIGVTTVEPSSLTTNQDAVVAGQKEVTLKVPHDAGIAYMRYTNTAGETAEIPVKRNDSSSEWTSQKPAAATVKSVEHGKFQDTIVLTMADKIAGTEVAAISNVVEGGFSSVAGWQPRSVENQAPTIASAVEGNKKTVQQGAQLDLASLVTVADKEDDAQATLGDKVHAEVVSVNGNAATKTVDTNTQGTYTVKYKAVDSQGKESGEIEVTVVVNPARENVAPTVEIPYSDPAPNKKEVYLYTGEDADVDITFNDDSGKIKSASLKKGGNIALNNIDGNPDKQDNEWGYTVTAINSETNTPAKIKVTGQVSGIAENRLPKTESDSLELVTRFATATDTDGAEISNNATKTKNNGEIVGTYLTDPGAVTFVLKAQTKKYDIKTPSEADKVAVSDANNVTDKEFEKIKEKVKVEYSQNNPDARLADKKGQEVENQSDRITSITKDGNNVVVTYKDGSKDTKPLSEFVNVAPKVELPYSNEANKQIYVYTGENTDLTFKASDNTAVKDMYVRGPGGIGEDNTAKYGFTTGKIENSAVTHGDGTVSGNTATIKMTGVTTLTAPNRWTSFVVANDNDNAPSNTDFNALDKNPNATQTPGYVQFIVKSQTDKYDIATPAPADKVEVANPDKVTDAEFDKIKEKLKLEYNKNNDDANIAKDSPVDKNGKIQSVEKEGNNLVVTYKDGSKDTKPLSEFVTKKPTDADKNDPTAKAQTVTPGSTPNAQDSIGNVSNLPSGTTFEFKTPVDTATEGEKDATVVVTYPDGTKDEVPVKVTVKGSDADKYTPVAKEQNVNKGETPDAKGSIDNAAGLPEGTTFEFKTPVDTTTPGEKDATVVVTYPDGSKDEVPVKVTVKAVKDPSVTPVKDPANLTDAEKAKVADEVKKVNPTATNVEVGKDGTTTVTFPDGSTATVTPDKTVKEADSNGVKTPAITPVENPSALTDAEKAKVADEVKKANPTAKDIKVNKDGSVVVTFKDGTTAIIPSDKTVKKSTDKVKESDGVKNPTVTPVVDPSNLTDAEKAKVADEVKKANPAATDVKVNNDGSVVVTFADGSVAVIASENAVKEATKESATNQSAKKAGAKELPNTGTEQSNASLGLALLAVATGGLLFAKKRKEEE